jgi:hypothetical protein
MRASVSSRQSCLLALAAVVVVVAADFALAALRVEVDGAFSMMTAAPGRGG